MRYQVAIDPGLTATGWAVFSDGKFRNSGTIWPKGPFRLSKMRNLADGVRKLFEYLEAQNLNRPEEVSIEQWESHSPSNRFQSMVACAEARGIIFTVSSEYTDTVKYITKGKSPKSQADFLARSLGVSGSEHARDAVHLGVLAGYHR